MNDIIEKELNIEDMIYEIRGKQVMLDSDLARLYHCTNGTKDINKAVKRNIERFPKDFYFQLTEDEKIQLWFQSGTANRMSRSLPYVFTEQGIAMLSSVLHTEKAIETSINIMRAFVKMRYYIKDNMLKQQNINNIVLEDHTHILKMDGDLKLLQEAFDKLEDKKKVNEIYFDGEFYTSYSRVIDIFNEAKGELIIVDRYADKTLLDMIKELKVAVVIITSKKSKLKESLIEKYNKQFNNLKIIYNETFHDRYYIIDRLEIYHSGTSINYMGMRTFSINKLEDNDVLESLLNKIIKNI